MRSRQPVSALDPFLEVLRANRFPAGLDHRLRLLQALDTWQGEFPPNRLRTLLCPLFATSAEEQRRFYELFDRHFPHFAAAETLTSGTEGGLGPSSRSSRGCDTARAGEGARPPAPRAGA